MKEETLKRDLCESPHISDIMKKLSIAEKVIGAAKSILVEKGKSLNNHPKQRDLSTLQRLEASRNIRQTVYQPEWLRTCKLTKHLKVEQTSKNQHLKAEMFDNIVKMKEIGSTIQAIGYNKGVPTLLILER